MILLRLVEIELSLVVFDRSNCVGVIFASCIDFCRNQVARVLARES